MPFTKPLIALDALSRGRRHGLHGRRLELQPMFLVPDPPALRAQPFPGSCGGQRSDDRRLLSLPACFHPQDTEAAFFVVVSDALDQSGDFLGHGPAFRDCGIHAWEFIFPWVAVACVTHYEPDFGCLARMGRIVDAHMAKRKSKSQPAWTDVKAKLADFDRAALLGLIQSLYAAHKDNQTFIHARFGLAEDVLEPYKKTIDRWLWPDLFRKQDTSVLQAKRAISDYKKAVGDSEGLAELMVFYCERAVGFCSDVGNDDEGYFDALVRMFEQALKLTNGLSAHRRDDLMTRLDRVRVISHKFGYGVGDSMDFLLSQFRARSL